MMNLVVAATSFFLTVLCGSPFANARILDGTSDGTSNHPDISRIANRKSNELNINHIENVTLHDPDLRVSGWEKCRLVVIVEDAEVNGQEEKTWWGCEVEATSIIYQLEKGDVQPGWIDDMMKSGELTKGHMQISRSDLKFNMKKNFHFVTQPKPHRDRELEETYNNYPRNLAVRGNKTVLIVGVLCQGCGIAGVDVQSTANNSQMSDSVFGTHGDSITLAGQYAACSEGQFALEPAKDRKGRHIQIVNGATTVHINTPLTEGHLNIVNDITEFLKLEFGVVNLKGIADYVMYCLPPGIEGFPTEMSVVNGWLSWYNDLRCTHATYQIHEIGHNLGLGYAAREGLHSDESGYMGLGQSKHDDTEACFNAANFFQLGWYEGACGMSLDQLDSERKVHLQGFSHDASLRCHDNPPSKKVVRVLNHEDNNHDLYMLFNWKAGYNQGTPAFANLVTIVTKENGPWSYGNTMLQATLNQGEEFVYEGREFTSGPCYVKISVTNIDLQLGECTILISAVGEQCLLEPRIPPPSTNSPTAAPITFAPSLSPTKPITFAPSLSPTQPKVISPATSTNGTASCDCIVKTKESECGVYCDGSCVWVRSHGACISCSNCGDLIREYQCNHCSTCKWDEKQCITV